MHADRADGPLVAFTDLRDGSLCDPSTAHSVVSVLLSEGSHIPALTLAALPACIPIPFDRSPCLTQRWVPRRCGRLAGKRSVWSAYRNRDVFENGDAINLALCHQPLQHSITISVKSIFSVSFLL